MEQTGSVNLRFKPVEVAFGSVQIATRSRDAVGGIAETVSVNSCSPNVRVLSVKSFFSLVPSRKSIVTRPAKHLYRMWQQLRNRIQRFHRAFRASR